jgi:hypothetical protein
VPIGDDIPDDVRELLRDAWTLISRQRINDAKENDWRERFRARLGLTDSFGDRPDADDVP